MGSLTRIQLGFGRRHLLPLFSPVPIKPSPPHAQTNARFSSSSCINNLLGARCSPLRILFKDVDSIVRFRKSGLCAGLTVQRNVVGSLGLLGVHLCRRGFTGMSAAAGAMYIWASDACAMDGTDAFVSPGESSGTLTEDLHDFWVLVRKFQFTLVLLLMVLLGWRHPVTLLVNVLLVLTCTRPSPYSVYMFVEQLRMQEMRRNPGVAKLKLFYARKVDVHDYKLMCLANVELREKKLRLVGILGSWWILQSSASKEN